MLVGGGETRTLPSAVKYADLVSWQVDLRQFARKGPVLAELCEVAGRDPAILRRTHAPDFHLFDSEPEYAHWRQNPDPGMSANEVDTCVRDRGAVLRHGIRHCRDDRIVHRARLPSHVGLLQFGPLHQVHCGSSSRWHLQSVASNAVESCSVQG